ncbi:protein SPEC3-like [Gigantopelta aegis]|uniref:protein SPEC3-like n=1 Tax=Gigantopelta aegis TaxID=1735272 RepID=UPI001B889220|nr:protein SPEC3-like [Gigantopelta aegis]
MIKGDGRKMNERLTVPAIPLPMAIACCALNFLIPGSGTVLAGFTSLCYAQDDMGVGLRCASCCIGFAVGLLQLLTLGVFLLGWIWSCIWGLGFLGMSIKYSQVSPLSATAHVIPSIVVQQPGQGQETGHVENSQYMSSHHHQIVYPSQPA